MWCSSCQQEVPGSLGEMGLAVTCNYCGTVANAVSEKSAATASNPSVSSVSRSKMVRVDRVATDTSAKNENANPSFDAAQRIQDLQIQNETQRTETPVHEIVGPKASRVTGFFVVFFLFGQLISTWAFMQAHFAAWIIGVMFSMVGVTLALLSLMSQQDEQKRDVLQLESLLLKTLQGGHDSTARENSQESNATRFATNGFAGDSIGWGHDVTSAT